MPQSDTTCWTMIRSAAAGDPVARNRFARVYLPVVRAYLVARWRAVPHPPDIDDAAQDVFVQCFRNGGLLEKVDSEGRGGFRAFLFGSARNVARKHENRAGTAEHLPDRLPADDTGPEQAFDRAWVRALLKEAWRVQEERAKAAGPAAARRLHLLRLRFGDGLPVREIARRWGEDPARLHHEYATAREEFRSALREVIAFHHPRATPGELERACVELLEAVG